MDNITARQLTQNKNFLIQEEPRGPSQLVEIAVTANGLSSQVFPSVPNLRSDVEQIIVIKALRIIPATVLTNGPITGNPVAPLTELVKMSMSIYCEGWLKAQNIPLLELVDTFTEASGIPWRNRTMQFNDWERVIWEKTNIYYSNGTVSAGAPYTVLLEVEYLKMMLEKGPGGQYTGKRIEIVGPS